MNISNWISHHANATPNKIALRTPNKTYSYAQFEVSVDTAAHMLQKELGVEVGDRVAFVGKNCAEFLIALLACARIGAMFVPLNWRLALPEHLYILQNADAKVLLLQEAYQQLESPVQESLPNCQIVGLDFVPASKTNWHTLIARPKQAQIRSVADLSTPMLIIYTSGTTGHPKGAVHTQSSVQWNAVHNLLMDSLTANDHVLTVLPLFHVGGFNVQTLAAFYCGATVTLHTAFDPDQTLNEISQGGITITHLVPSMMRACVHSPQWHQTKFSQLRALTTGSSLIPRELCEAFMAKGVAVTTTYGATETAGIVVYMRADLHPEKPKAVGMPALHCTIKVVDAHGMPQAIGNEGEIVIKSPTLMSGYWQNEAATRRALNDGWYSTGDVGSFDEDGFLSISGRKKNMIIKGGENIYPAEIERVLNTHPDIQECAIVGVPDEQWQEIPIAVVVLAEGVELTTQALRLFLANYLADYKLPHQFVFTDSLAKNALGKLQHFRIREVLLASGRLESAACLVEEIRPNSAELRQQILALPVEERYLTLFAEVQRLTRSILDWLSPNDITHDAHWMALGLSSLTMVELRNILHAHLDYAFPLTKFYEYPTVAELVDYLLDSIVDHAERPTIVTNNAILPADWPAIEPLLIAASASDGGQYGPSPAFQTYFESYTSPTDGSVCTDVHIVLPLIVHSQLNPDALEKACRAIVKRHDAFRSTFQSIDGQLIHQVSSTPNVDFECIDVTMWDEERLNLAVQHASEKPFDLATDSMARFRLYHRPHQPIFLIVVHHIVMDGGSTNTFFNDLGLLYQAALAGEEHPLPPVPISLVMYNRWLEALWESPAGHKLKRYWETETDNINPIRSNIFDHQPNDSMSPAGARYYFRFDTGFDNPIDEWGKRTGVTATAVCLAAYLLLLSQYSEQQDVSTGVALLNRMEPQFANVIGCIETDGYLRVQWEEDLTVEQFLTQVGTKFLEIFSHQAYSWQLIKDRLIANGNHIPTMCYPFYFNFQQYAVATDAVDVSSLVMQGGKAVDLHGLQIERYTVPCESIDPNAWCYLHWDISVEDGEVVGFAYYRPSLFHQSTIERLTAEYQRLLHQLVSSPTAKLSSLRLEQGNLNLAATL